MKAVLGLLLVLAAAGTSLGSTVAEIEERAPTSCIIAPVVPPPPFAHCGGEATLKHPTPLGSPFKVFPSATGSAFQSCRDACMNKAGCLSFGYAQATRFCHLYADNLRNQGIEDSTTSGVFYYGRRCFSISCPGSGGIAKTKTVTVTTTTTVSGSGATPIVSFSTGFNIDPLSELDRSPLTAVTGAVENVGLANSGESYYQAKFPPNQGGRVTLETPDYSVPARTSCTTSVWARAGDFAGTCTLQIQAISSSSVFNGIAQQKFPISGGYKQFTLSFNTGKFTDFWVDYNISCENDGAQPTVMVDDVSLACH